MDLDLRNFIVLPFNIDHGMKAGQLWNLISRDDGDSKAVVKDDLKLIAQCACEGSISHFLTGDERGHSPNTFDPLLPQGRRCRSRSSCPMATTSPGLQTYCHRPAEFGCRFVQRAASLADSGGGCCL
ncbi:MAG: hypothetical protein Q8L49_15335 [Burkholderiaceae bacterium]|nr:hypothetical protein [Burkholderiaceae bacterium]